MLDSTRKIMLLYFVRWDKKRIMLLYFVRWDKKNHAIFLWSPIGQSGVHSMIGRRSLRRSFCDWSGRINSGLVAILLWTVDESARRFFCYRSKVSQAIPEGSPIGQSGDPRRIAHRSVRRSFCDRRGRNKQWPCCDPSMNGRWVSQAFFVWSERKK